jgi:hypothetical protein
MKTKVLFLTTAVVIAATLPVSAQRVATRTSSGRTVVAGNFSRPFCHGSSVSIGIGFPYYGGFYGGFPYYGFPYYGGYYPSYGRGYGYYPYGFASYGAPVHGRPVYGGNYRGSTVARVQGRLARAGYYTGSIDGLMGPRTRSAIRSYERRHGLPVDGVIDSRLLATMGLA